VTRLCCVGHVQPNTTMGASFAYESEPYDLARREERESAAADSRKRIGPAFKAMSHGDMDFNTCNEFKDGGLAPDDPFRRIKTQAFDRPFMPSGARQTPGRRACLTHRLSRFLATILCACVLSLIFCGFCVVCVRVSVNSSCQVTQAAGHTEQVSGIQGGPYCCKGG
jgi:hypothetical protein